MKVLDNWTTWPQAEAGLRLLVAALLHDVVEDTACTLDRVRDRFGPRVAELG